MTLVLLALAASSLSPVEIIERAAKAEATQRKLRERYVYRERLTFQPLDKRGQPSSDKPRITVYEHIFLEGSPYRLLVERNGQPLSEKERDQVEKEKRAEAQRRQQERRKGRRFFPGTRHADLGNLQDLPEFAMLSLAGEEMVEGIPVYAIDAEPRSSGPEKLSEPRRYRQRLWIHREEFVVVRRDAEMIAPGGEIDPGSKLSLRFAKEAQRGVWFARRYEVNFIATMLGVKKQRGLQQHEFFDFREFNVESTITPLPEDPQ